MKKVFYRTSLLYLVACSIIEIGLLLMAFRDFVKSEIDGMWFFFAVLYLAVVCACVIETIKNRKEFDEILKNGYFVDAKVIKLKKVYFDYDWGRGGGLLIKYYQVEAEYDNHVKCSAPFFKRYKNRLPDKVKIYSYMGKEYFIWDYSRKEKRQYNTVEGEIFKVKLNRVFLSLFTSIFGASLIIILFGVLI